MITKEDLMIGDYVIFNPNAIHNTKQKRFVYLIQDGEDIDAANEGFYLPIEITEEILLGIGYEKQNEFEYTSTNGRVILNCNPDYLNSNNVWYVHVDNVDYDTTTTFEITYLHNFQHGLKLAGYEQNFEKINEILKFD